jgi:pimeloyl-ACP methyl ester carboxylesterase
MIGTSPAEYIFIRACILFLHNIAPASVLHCVQLLLRPFLPLSIRCYRIPFPIEVWLVAEAVFFTVVFLPLRYRLQRSAIYHEPMSKEGRERLFRCCNSNVADPEKYLRRWLMVAKSEHIKHENVKDFIRWAFFHTGQAQEQHEPEVEAYTRDIEKLFGLKLPPGRANVKSLGQLLQEVGGLHRSLLWYTVGYLLPGGFKALHTDIPFLQCVSVVDTIMYYKMLYNGFHLHRSSFSRFFTLFPFRPLTLFSAYRSPAKHLTYWHSQHTSKNRLPMLFIHGIGIGLYPYTNFLRDLATELGIESNDDGEVGIIALEIMPVSSRITHSALKKNVMIREILEIVQYHGWSRFVLVSHSYGSIIATHLLKSILTTSLVGPTVFIDPISFLLHLPDVAYNFTARQPVQANEHQLWYFGSKDIGVAHTLARRFCWSENIIWKEDLGLKGENNKKEGREVTVVLSGKDLIVDAEAVGQYLMSSSLEGILTVAKLAALTNSKINEAATEWKSRPWTGSGLEVLWFEQLDHAQVFDVEKTRKPIIKAISVYSSTG